MIINERLLRPHLPLERKDKFYRCITGVGLGPRRLVFGPIDEVMIDGGSKGMYRPRRTVIEEARSGVDAMMMFRGTLRDYGHFIPPEVAVVVNATVSTVWHDHTRKMVLGRLPFGSPLRRRGQQPPHELMEDIIRLGGDAVGVHVNVGSKFESEMLANLGAVAIAADRYGLPLLVLVYPRKEGPDGRDHNYHDLREHNLPAYTALVRHCVQIAKGAGANLIKTTYTGTTESFRTVIETAEGTPVIIAGEAQTSPLEALTRLKGALDAGAAGPAFGRNFFNSGFIADMVRATALVTHDNMDPYRAAELHGLLDADPPPEFVHAHDYWLDWRRVDARQQAWWQSDRSGGRRGSP